MKDGAHSHAHGGDLAGPALVLALVLAAAVVMKAAAEAVSAIPLYVWIILAVVAVAVPPALVVLIVRARRAEIRMLHADLSARESARLDTLDRKLSYLFDRMREAVEGADLPAEQFRREAAPTQRELDRHGLYSVKGES